jgi:hypothetical protein
MSSFIPYAWRVQTMSPLKTTITEITMTASSIAAPREAERRRLEMKRFFSGASFTIDLSGRG